MTKEEIEEMRKQTSALKMRGLSRRAMCMYEDSLQAFHQAALHELLYNELGQDSDWIEAKGCRDAVAELGRIE